MTYLLLLRLLISFLTFAALSMTGVAASANAAVSKSLYTVAPNDAARELTEADYLRRIQLLEKHFGTSNVHSLQKHGAQPSGLAQYRRVQRSTYPNPTTGAPGNPTKVASKFLTHRDHYRALRGEGQPVHGCILPCSDVW